MSNKNIESLFFFILNKIASLRFLPRWVVLVIDFLIVSFSIVLTYLLINGLGLTFIQFVSYYEFYIVYSLISIISFWIMKTYHGIIRHSSLVDSVRLFVSQLFSHLCFVLLNVFFLKFYGKKFCLNTGILLNFLISFSILFSFRVFIKYLFEKFNFSNGQKKEKILIYGLNENSIALANALKNISSSKFLINGFISNNSRSKHKSIVGLPIFELKRNLPLTLRLLNADGIVFTEDNSQNDFDIKLAEDCISYSFKVYKLPLISNFDSKNLPSKLKKIDIHDLLERDPIKLDLLKISQDLKNKTILVTGAAGSIGSEIVRQLIGFEIKKILILDQAETPLNDLMVELESVNKKVKLLPYLVDVRDFSALKKVFELNKVDYIFHAAAYKHVPLLEKNPDQAVLVNILGTKNMVDLAEEHLVQKFVMISTDKAVNPSSVMGASKRIAELFVQHRQKIANDNKKNIKFIITRFGNVLGSNGSVVPLFTKQIDNGGPVTLTHPDIIRYFMTISEACQLVLEAASMGNGGEIFLFDMGKPVKIIDLAKKMIRLAGLIPNKDIKIEITGLRPGEKLYEELLVDYSVCLPTYNDKITIAIEEDIIVEKIEDNILEILKFSKMHDIDNMIICMKTIISNYVSLNSDFEKFN